MIESRLSDLGDIQMLVGAELDILRWVVAGLTDVDLVRGTGCEGWRVADLVVHLRLDAETLLTALAAPTDASADRDFVTHWRDWPWRGPASFAQVRWTWALAASYPSGEGLRRHFDDMAKSAAMAARNAPGGRRSIQGHVLDVADLLATFAVEFGLHHLDLLAEMEDRAGPIPGCLVVAARTVDGLLDTQRPPWWDELTYLKKATGRQPLEVDERERLGERASCFPVFG